MALRARKWFDAKSADVTLIKGGGGVFEVTVNGTLLFSKKQLGRFPTDDELQGMAGD
ncbi:MAG: SelT/SelW/SelH family protein [Gammaproteobacteria bacterium]|nr:SelT/SelW/SelH family protein [Gammaproteobacteria bacterium]